MTLRERLARRDNSLNALRLLFAMFVIASHSWALTGRDEPGWGGVPLGGWAVAGFFAISGYLISCSRLRTDLPTYLVRRAQRIYPGYWVCCAVIAFVLSPIAAQIRHTQYEPFVAVRYVILNAGTFIFQVGIGPETAAAPADFDMWNGSAWTLSFEITCYMVAGALLTLDRVRRHATITAGLVLGISTLYSVVSDSQRSLAWFLGFFAAGWLISTLGDRLSPTAGTIALMLSMAALSAVAHPALAALPAAYATLAMGALIPARWLTTNDVSYGTYLYGWPIQQVLLALGMQHVGLPLFVVFALTGALTLGAASWFLVERRSLPRAGTRQSLGESLRAAEPASLPAS